MNEPLYTSQILDKVDAFIGSLSEAERGKLTDDRTALEAGDFNSLHIKTLTGKIKELIEGRYRLVFFVESGTVYYIHIFVKKSNKTPPKDIQYAKKLYKLITHT